MAIGRQKASIALVVIFIAGAGALMLLSLLGLRSIGDAWDSAFGPRVNGSWRAVTLDWRSVLADDYVLAVKRGKVVGGYDDCNGWGFEDEAPGPNGDRMVTSTLVACPDKEARNVYHIIAYGPRMELLNDRELRMARAGHVGLFHRCKPDREGRHCVVV